MRVPNDDPTRSFQREMQRAERERKQLLVLVGAATLVVVAGGLIVAGVVVGRSSQAADADARTKRLAQSSAATVGQAPEPEPTKTADPATAPPNAKKSPETAAPDPEPEPEPKPKPAPKPAPAPAVQRFSIGIGQYGYDPAAISAKAGIPIKLTVAQGEGCAAGFLIPSLNVAADNSSGPAVVDLPALAPGRYRYSCGMDMVRGTLVVR